MAFVFEAIFGVVFGIISGLKGKWYDTVSPDRSLLLASGADPVTGLVMNMSLVFSGRYCAGDGGRRPRLL